MLDNGAFAGGRYFDVVVEYAQAAPGDLLFMRVTSHNRGPEAAELHLLPTVWFRNTWSWNPDAPRPSIRRVVARRMAAAHPSFGESLVAVDWGDLLFTENDTNPAVFGRLGAG